VEFEGHRHVVSPAVISRPGAEDLERLEAPIARTGLNLILHHIDSAQGRALFHIAPAPREYLYAEVSLKPFIILLWIGTALTITGLAVATLHRGRLAGRLARAAMGVEGGAKNGAREAA
jgi:hypothetical protein